MSVPLSRKGAIALLNNTAGKAVKDKAKAQSQQYKEALSQLDALLAQYETLWQAHEFSSRGVAGALQGLATYPELARAVEELSLCDIESLDANPARLNEWLKPFILSFSTLPSWLSPFLYPYTDASQPEQPVLDVPFWLESGIGGRKLSQIKHFIAQLPPLHGAVIEWCAGKGHLGRLWSYVQQQLGNNTSSVNSVEWQEALCEQGRKLAHQHQLEQQFSALDVLHDDTSVLFRQSQHAIALHACGDLHRRLLEQGATYQLDQIIIAPCCYHLTAQTQYQPLSAYAAKRSQLALSTADLKLAVQGQVTAGQRTQRLRQREVTWRLGYQLMREELLGEPDYRPLPTFKKSLLSTDFSSFCSWAAKHHEWELRVKASMLTAVLGKAEAMYLTLKRIDLVRHSFRRVIELWLVLDRVIYLNEQGYEVKLDTFCAYQDSPRNFILKARHKKAS